MRKILTAVLLAVASLTAVANAQVVTAAQGFSVSAPVALVNQGSTSGTSDYGLPYTITKYTATLANGDTYGVGVAVYNTELDDATSTRAVQKVASGSNLTIIQQMDTTVSGRPAKAAIFKNSDDSLRLIYIAVVRGAVLYQFIMAGNPQVPLQAGESADAFFNSITLN